MIRRRHFLLNGLAAVSLAAGSTPRLGHADEGRGKIGPGRRVTLRPANHDLFRVRIEMDLQGNVNLARNELVSKKQARQLPLDFSSVTDYEERLYRDNAQTATRSRRYYYEALSEGETAGTPQRIDLRDSARHVAAHLGQGACVRYATSAYLTHEELNLLHLPMNSMAVSRWLPADAIAQGESYALDRDALADVLDLDAVQDSDVQGTLVGLDADAAKLQLKGKVQGSVAGVPTEIDLAGKITFDLHSRTCTWVALALREQREIGKAEPGFEIAATIKMVRKPLDKATHVSDRPLPAEPPVEKLLVNLYSTPGRYGVLMDRHWQMIRQSKSLSRMRMVRDDRDIAQCDVRHLPSLEPGVQITLEGLQADIRQSLGKQFSEFLRADEEVNSSGLRIVRLHALGAVQGVPVQWVFAHCSDDTGRRILATFTLAADKIEAFGGADEQFVQSLRFIDLASEEASNQETDSPAAAKASEQTASRGGPESLNAPERNTRR